MMEQIKIYILVFVCLALNSLAFTSSLSARQPDVFVNNEELGKQIWKLAGWLPQASAELSSGWRMVEISDTPGLPPTVIKMFFPDALNPWPSMFSIEVQAEDADPTLLTITGVKPFDAPNLSINGAKVDNEQEKIHIYELISNINIKLDAGRARIGELKWIAGGDGVELAKLKLLYGARIGINDLYIVRFDQSKFLFQVYHESQFAETNEADIKAWSQRLADAIFLINGGQYYPDKTYMGLLRSNGVDISEKTHKGWQGFFVSGLKKDAPADAPVATIIDLDTHTRQWNVNDYDNIMQSFMLLDRLGRVRVRDSHNLASRSAIGCDEEGRLVMVMTPAAMSLYDLALVLKSRPLNLKEVLGLDGGFEAQMLLKQNQTLFTAQGYFSISGTKSLFLPGYSANLPAVLAVTAKPSE